MVHAQGWAYGRRGGEIVTQPHDPPVRIVVRFPRPGVSHPVAILACTLLGAAMWFAIIWAIMAVLP